MKRDLADRPDASEALAASEAAQLAHDAERRNGSDRRQRTLHALLYGSLKPRRRRPRRGDELHLSAVDWHPPQWLAVAIFIVLLSCFDAYLTLNLMERGAYEVNPVMAPLVGGSALAFTVVKVVVTAGGVTLLTILARMRAFGRVPISLLLYLVLITYAVLVLYELQLLKEIPFTP